MAVGIKDGQSRLQRVRETVRQRVEREERGEGRGENERGERPR